MKKLRKILSIFLILLIISGYFPDNNKTSYAASVSTFYLTAYSFDSGTLTLRWPTLANCQSVWVTFHSPTNPVTATEIKKDQITNTIDIPGLLDDIIYDIKLEVYDGAGCTGNKIGRGFFYFCPNISFRSKILDQSRKAVTGGGFEIGTSPALNLQWTIPKVWVEGSDTFEYANQPAALLDMQSKINSFYNDTRVLSTLNFRINISTDYSNLNSGSAQSALIISQVNPAIPSDPITYSAIVSGSSLTASVNDMDSSGQVNFDLIGRASSAADLPTAANAYQLPDADIIPGTVYYMNIKPIIRNTAGAAVNAITVGPGMNQNGSRLLGAVPYTYSPIRFQISRDDANNVYVKVFRINQGSLDLPALKYEVQTGDDPTIEGDWKVRKSLNDSYFPNNSPYALTAFTVNNPNNPLYYKVVVKTDASSDRLESPKMPYTLNEDNSRPPVPTNLTVTDRTASPGDVIDPTNNTAIAIKSTDVTISWNKPSNWNEIISANPYNESNDVYFHFVISTNQVDLTSLPYPQLEFNGKVFGEYQAKYRLMKYVSARSPNIIQDGNRLSYTIKGLELFKGEDADGISDNDIPNPDKYPTFLIPNKIYFLQMYTASGAYKGSTDPEFISEKSVPVSFTTLTMGGREVPLPMNLRLNKNGSETIAGPPVVFSNYLELQFDKIKVNWMDYTTNMSVTKSIYYDLYSSSSTATDSFIKIGSTENPIGDVKFVGIDVQSSSIKATLRNFSNDTDAYNIFGPKLKPNATYYYMIKTRLAFGSSTQESMFTSILSVTTVNGNISPPDETSRNPIAPVDFSIAKDSSGNQLVSGSTAVFQWTNKEPDVSYEMICTSATIATNAPLSAYTDDIYYNSFKAAFGDLLLDPGAIPLADNFKYDSLSKKCNYTLDQWISPNKLYFISIRAVNNTTGKVSAWVCIPLTTLLIESPASINAVTDSEIAIYWQDKSASATPDDFKLFLKGPDDNNYKELSRSQFIVSKENNIYYGRIFNLKYDATYNVKVLKGDSDSTLVLEKLNIATMDKAHTVEVKWKGRIGYNYEIGIKSADDVDYTIVTASDLEEVTNSDGKVLPYYIEKSPDVTGTTFYNFYGKIKTVATTQIDGTVKHVPLKSNMKYYVKVRAYKVDSLDSTIVSYSKYLGPIDVRTEFNQDDYDNTDQDTKKKAILLDKIGKLEEELLWKMSVNSNVNKLLLKGDRMINALQNNGRYPYILDISSMSSNVDQDVLYIPTKVVRLLNTEDRSLVIKTSGAEFTIRPRTLDIDAINSSNNINTENDFFKMTATRSDGGISLPQNASLASKITTISLTALDTQKDDTEIESLVKDKLYNDKTGLIQERVNLVLSTNSVKLTPGEMDNFLTDQSLELEMELASYIQKLIEGSGSVLGIIKTESPVTLFNDPLLVKIAYSNSQGKLYPYVLSDGGGSWKKLTDSAYTQTNIDISFSTLSTGKYAVLTAQTSSIDIPQNSKVADDLNKLSKRYDLSSVFGTGSSFYPENTITVKEIVDLYEVLSGKGSNWAGLDTKQKISKLGLSDAFGGVNTMKGLEKQELSAVVGKLYTSRMGIDINSFMPAKKLQITDEADINAKRVKYVTLCLDIKVFSLDEKGYFKPGVTMTRADAVAAFVKVLDITGDLS